MAKDKAQTQIAQLPKDVAKALSPELASLHRRWINVIMAIEAEDDKFARVEAAAWKRGESTEGSSELAPIIARRNLLWDRKCKIIHEVSSLRSHSLAELAISGYGEAKVRIGQVAYSTTWTAHARSRSIGTCCV